MAIEYGKTKGTAVITRRDGTVERYQDNKLVSTRTKSGSSSSRSKSTPIPQATQTQQTTTVLAQGVSFVQRKDGSVEFYKGGKPITQEQALGTKTQQQTVQTKEVYSAVPLITSSFFKPVNDLSKGVQLEKTDFFEKNKTSITPTYTTAVFRTPDNLVKGTKLDEKIYIDTKPMIKKEYKIETPLYSEAPKREDTFIDKVKRVPIIGPAIEGFSTGAKEAIIFKQGSLSGEQQAEQLLTARDEIGRYYDPNLLSSKIYYGTKRVGQALGSAVMIYAGSAGSGFAEVAPATTVVGLGSKSFKVLGPVKQGVTFVSEKIGTTAAKILPKVIQKPTALFLSKGTQLATGVGLMAGSIKAGEKIGELAIPKEQELYFQELKSNPKEYKEAYKAGVAESDKYIKTQSMATKFGYLIPGTEGINLPNRQTGAQIAFKKGVKEYLVKNKGLSTYEAEQLAKSLATVRKGTAYGEVVGFLGLNTLTELIGQKDVATLLSKTGTKLITPTAGVGFEAGLTQFNKALYTGLGGIGWAGAVEGGVGTLGSQLARKEDINYLDIGKGAALGAATAGALGGSIIALSTVKGKVGKGAGKILEGTLDVLDVYELPGDKIAAAIERNTMSFSKPKVRTATNIFDNAFSSTKPKYDTLSFKSPRVLSFSESVVPISTSVKTTTNVPESFFTSSFTETSINPDNRIPLDINLDTKSSIQNNINSFITSNTQTPIGTNIQAEVPVNVNTFIGTKAQTQANVPVGVYDGDLPFIGALPGGFGKGRGRGNAFNSWLYKNKLYNPAKQFFNKKGPATPNNFANSYFAPIKSNAVSNKMLNSKNAINSMLGKKNNLKLNMKRYL